MKKTSLTLKKNELEEQLVALFLRLNGYFTSGFIVHSGHKGDIKQEVDILAARFPFNSELEREVQPCPELLVPIDRVDFIIGEVKNKVETPHFNPSIFERENIEYQLRWLGAFSGRQVQKISKQLLSDLNNRTDGFPIASKPDKTELPHCQVRLILFDLNPEHAANSHCISGQAIMDYIWKCLRTDAKPKECARRYNYDAWGPVYSPMVRYFKDKRRKNPGTIEDLMNWIFDKYPASADEKADGKETK